MCTQIRYIIENFDNFEFKKAYQRFNKNLLFMYSISKSNYNIMVKENYFDRIY